MKYDDYSWHYGGDYPDDLPDEAAATHTGMFYAWSLLSGLGAALHIEDCPEDLEDLNSKAITPGQAFIRHCDGKLTDEDLSDEGNLFAAAYFDLENSEYIDDYANALCEGLPSLYHVADTWDNFEKLRPILDEKFKLWRRAT